MNIYRHRFICACPSNGQLILFDLEIESETMIHVEHIVTAAALHKQAYHEQIADHLHGMLGGRQTLRAHHHGVDIETRRGRPADGSGFRTIGHISAAHGKLLGTGVSVLTHITPDGKAEDVELYVKGTA